jgi:hypothetical protein
MPLMHALLKDDVQSIDCTWEPSGWKAHLHANRRDIHIHLHHLLQYIGMNGTGNGPVRCALEYTEGSRCYHIPSIQICRYSSDKVNHMGVEDPFVWAQDSGAAVAGTDAPATLLPVRRKLDALPLISPHCFFFCDRLLHGNVQGAHIPLTVPISPLQYSG